MAGLVNVDLFAGVGGFHVGWQRNSVATVWASEWDTHSAAVYTQNFDLAPAGDITRIAATDVPAHNILSAGFPCQAFSISGKQLGFADTRGTLFFDVARIVKHHQPELVLLENVRNFTRHDHGRTLDTVLTTMAQIGYDTRWKVLTASNHGVPQHRQRVYIAGFHRDLVVAERFQWPTPTPLTRSVTDVLEPPDQIPPTMVVTRPDVVIDRKRVDAADRLLTPTTSPIRVGSVGNGGQGNRIYHHAGSSITLSAHGGGVGAKTGLYLTPEGVVRRLTPREAARLMGFPDTFAPHTSRSQALQQFGNAVVADVVEQVGAHMLAVLPTSNRVSHPTRSAA